MNWKSERLPLVDKKLKILISVDAGNTETVFGVWQNSQIIYTFRTATSRESTAEDWRRLVETQLFQERGILAEGFEAAIVSVVPPVEEPLRQCFLSLGAKKCLLGRRDMKFPFRFLPQQFPTVGIDRLVNMAAGSELFGENLVVVDFGTAITFCLLAGNEYRGGVIAPGVHSSLGALNLRASSLPEVSFGKKEAVLVTSTVEQMESGVYFGFKGLVREILFELQSEVQRSGANTGPLKLIATGGLSSTLGFAHDFFDVVDPFLTLRGIHRFYLLNS